MPTIRVKQLMSALAVLGVGGSMAAGLITYTSSGDLTASTAGSGKRTQTGSEAGVQDGSQDGTRGGSRAGSRAEQPDEQPDEPSPADGRPYRRTWTWRAKDLEGCVQITFSGRVGHRPGADRNSIDKDVGPAIQEPRMAIKTGGCGKAQGQATGVGPQAWYDQRCHIPPPVSGSNGAAQFDLLSRPRRIAAGQAEARRSEAGDTAMIKRDRARALAVSRAGRGKRTGGPVRKEGSSAPSRNGSPAGGVSDECAGRPVAGEPERPGRTADAVPPRAVLPRAVLPRAVATRAVPPRAVRAGAARTRPYGAEHVRSPCCLKDVPFLVRGRSGPNPRPMRLVNGSRGVSE